MSLKTIIVHIDATPRANERVRLAAQLAIEHDAHLIGLAPTGWSSLVFAGGAIGPVITPVSMELEARRQHCLGALAAFETQVRALGLTSIETRMVEEEAGIALAMHGRYSDLVIVGQTRGAGTDVLVRADFPEFVILNCTAPVMVVPAAGTFDNVGRNVAVAWNGSPEARRAIASAIPVLQRAQRVSLIIINPEQAGLDEGDEPGADMGVYLARQGIAVDVLSRPNTAEVDEAIFACAASCGADMIVMGAYGRSRFREFLLGGATRAMLESMKVPVWMSH